MTDRREVGAVRGLGGVVPGGDAFGDHAAIETPQGNVIPGFDGLQKWDMEVDGVPYTFLEPSLVAALMLRDGYTQITMRNDENGEPTMSLKLDEARYWKEITHVYITPEIKLNKIGARADAHVRRVIAAWEKCVGMEGLRAAVTEAMQQGTEGKEG